MQVVPLSHVPQSKACPQPSPTEPQNLLVPAVHTPGWQLAPPTHKLLTQLQSVGHVMPQSSWPLQPSPMEPQYWPPSGVHETEVLQPPPDSPPELTTMALPAVPDPCCPAAPPEPVLPAAPRTMAPGAGLELQLEAASAASAENTVRTAHFK